MAHLLVIGGGLVGSAAAALARSRGLAATVFDAGLAGAASPASAGFFHPSWIGRRHRHFYERAIPILDRLFGIRTVSFTNEAGATESVFCVPPATILEPRPVRAAVTAVGDGWLEAGGLRHVGLVYVAAGIWCPRLVPGLAVHGKAGAAFLFPGERLPTVRCVGPARRAYAFVRDPGTTYFSDGTAEPDYRPEHEAATLANAAAHGLLGEPTARLWGVRPCTSGGPLFRRLGNRLWVATGARKMGTILAAAFAARLFEEATARRT